VKLFPDQEEVVYGDQGIYWAFENGHTKVCLRAATGFGKTVVMVHTIKDVLEAEGRALLLVPLDQLRRQAMESALAGGIPADQICTIGVDKKPDLSRPLVITSVQTVSRRKELLTHYKWTLILLDEAHISAFYRSLDPLWGDEMQDQKVLGVTATPVRLKKTEAFSPRFSHMTVATPEAELMRLHRLCPSVRYFGFKSGGQIDTSSVHTVRGDFDQGELEIASDQPELLLHCVNQWKRLCEGRRTLVFCVSIRHAEHAAQTFTEAGIPAAMVCADTPLQERLEIYRKLDSGELQVLTSRDVLAVGFNSIHISAICLCRSTKSLAVYLQQLGRGLRAAADKGDLIVLDQAGCVTRFGPAEMPREWSLSPPERTKSEGGGEAPMKQCPECEALIPASAKVCPECGKTQPVKEKQIRTDSLVELKFDQEARRRQQQLHRWIRKAHEKGYLQGWVIKQYERKFNGHPKTEDWLGAIYGPDPGPTDPHELAARWADICSRKNRGWPLALSALTREFGPETIEPISLELRQVWQSQQTVAA